MNAQDYVKSLFKDFEETAQLNDFMEEIQSNLEERTASLIKKGLSEAEAFTKASAELGDIGVLADEMSLKRRQEVYKDAYLGIQRYMKPRRVAGYVVFGTILGFGIIVTLISFISVNKVFPAMILTSTLGTFMPFFITSVTGFTFLGLTQESAAYYPMSRKRAVWYSVAAFLIAFGIILFPLSYFAVSEATSIFNFSLSEWGLVSALGVLIPFLIPGIGLLVFLCLTEKSRLKPWAATHYSDMYINPELWQDPAMAARFGMFSGALWVFAIGIFIALGFAISFKYSWLIFIFSIAVQLLIQALLFKPKEHAAKEENL